MPRQVWSVIAVAAGLLLPLAGGAACLPENFPQRWLESQERQGGHTLALHVGRTDQQLIDRLKQEKRLREESSFSNLGIAESTIETALQRNRGSIEAWAAHAKPRQRHAWHFRADQIVGRGAYRPIDRSHIAERSGVTAVVMKNADGSC